jgi:hypothetical protein
MALKLPWERARPGLGLGQSAPLPDASGELGAQAIAAPKFAASAPMSASTAFTPEVGTVAEPGMSSATAGALGAGLSTGFQVADPSGMGVGSVLAPTASMAATGFAIGGGPVGAVIGGTLGLAAGILGVGAKRKQKEAEARANASNAMAAGYQKAGDALKGIKLGSKNLNTNLRF